MQLSKTTRIVLIITAGVIVLTIAVLSFLSGVEITIGDSLSALGLFIGGILAAMGFGNRVTVAGILVALLPATAGCVATMHPWQIARGTVAGAEAALDAVEPTIPDNVEGRFEAFEIARDSLDALDFAVDIWERERTNDAPTGWTTWVGDALNALSRILTIAKIAGAPIPQEVIQAAVILSALAAGYL